MRLAARRTVGVIGATGVAIGAAMVLALPASAHTPNIQASCDSYKGQMVLSIDLSSYVVGPHGEKNTVTATDTPEGGAAITLVDTPFGTAYNATFNATSTPATGSASVANHFHVKVTAQDFPNNPDYSKTYDKVIYPCVKTPPPPPSSTTTAPPTTTTTTAPPTTTTTTTGSTTAPATTTSEAVVAAASTTPAAPGSGSLPFTGVNTALPLGIAGLLVVAGGGILFWLKFNARRRHSS
jgi:hypothetical protein